MDEQTLTVEVSVQAPVTEVWEKWVSPEHIQQWNSASSDWFCPVANNDLRPGGKFSYRMQARNGSMGFDFEGEYTGVIPHSLIEYRMGEGPEERRVRVDFESENGRTLIRETFTPDNTYTPDQQKEGWQNILHRFKNYVEGVPA